MRRRPRHNAHGATRTVHEVEQEHAHGAQLVQAICAETVPAARRATAEKARACVGVVLLMLLLCIHNVLLCCVGAGPHLSYAQFTSKQQQNECGVPFQ